MNIMTSVKEIMKTLVNIGPNQTVFEVANLMNDADRGSLLIVDGKITVGIITERPSYKSYRKKPSTQYSSFRGYVFASHYN